MANKTGKYINCEYCGKQVYKTLSQYNKRVHHYCSNKCQALHKREQVYEHRACEICGVDMYIPKISTKRFCSIKCQSIWQRQNTGFKNKKFKGGFVRCECCGKEFLVGSYIYNDARHHFCSKECRKTWYSTVWSQSDEWREESRKRATEILQQATTTQTKPQVITNNLLHDMGIAYRNEEPFVYYSIDNYLQDFNLAIEVMGDYWHSSPVKYPETFNATQAKVISRDKAKHTYIKNHYGIDILYLWEKDIMTNLPLCKALIASYVENAGKLNDYNSFNYTLKEGVLTLNNDIIKTHQEKNARLMS